jgi:acetylornithine deacetylase/succinyl-diaminopimelate desuccinylase-like protein
MGGERVADTLKHGDGTPQSGSTPLAVAADDVIDFTQQIVRQSSVTGEEGPLGEFLARRLKEVGLEVALDEVAPHRYNVLAFLRGDDPTMSLLFHGHIDTVPFGAMSDPLSAEVRGDHLWGRGSVDQKGGVAAAVMAVAAIAEAGHRLDRSLGLALVVDEESEHRGSMALVEGGIQADMAVVTEPSDLRVVVGCKGTLPFQIRVAGKAAHGCRPWLGVNAVHQAFRVVQALEDLDFATYDVPNVGTVQGSLNLGAIEGGRAYNIVPDECLLWFDRRFVPEEDRHTVLDGVQAILDRLAREDPAVESWLRVARPDWDWEPIEERGLLPAVNPSGARIQDIVMRHHQAVLGSPPELYFTDGYSEMDFLINDLGIPTVQYGPGDGGLCHTDEEALSIPQLLKATQVYLGVALEAAVDRG